MMKKTVKDGQVAVLYSPEYGSGWYTSHHIEELLFDPSIIQWVELEEYDKIKTYMTLRYPDLYLGRVEDLHIRWIPLGTLFKIDEYDGNESISLRDMENWIIA
jgi:hypothetical protein